MRKIFLFTILLSIITSVKSFADDVGVVFELKPNELTAKITDEKLIQQSQYFFVVDSKNKKVGWLKINKIEDQVAYFKILKGKADPGQTIINYKLPGSKMSLNRFLRHSPWGAEYNLSLGGITSSTSTIKTSILANSFWARYVFPIKDSTEIMLLGGFKLSQDKVTYADGTITSINDLAGVFSGRVNYILNSEWHAYAFSTFDRYFVTRVQSVAKAPQAFIYKSSTGVGAERYLPHGITARSDIALVLPNHSATNSIKSGFELAIGAEYEWKNIQFGYRGLYQKIKTDTDSDSGLINTLSLGYNF